MSLFAEESSMIRMLDLYNRAEVKPDKAVVTTEYSRDDANYNTCLTFVFSEPALPMDQWSVGLAMPQGWPLGRDQLETYIKIEIIQRSKKSIYEELLPNLIKQQKIHKVDADFSPIFEALVGNPDSVIAMHPRDVWELAKQHNGEVIHIESGKNVPLEYAGELYMYGHHVVKDENLEPGKAYVCRIDKTVFIQNKGLFPEVFRRMFPGSWFGEYDEKAANA